MMLFQCSWTTVTLISACKELMLDVFSSIGEDVMVGVGCTARRDARNSDLLKIDEIDPTYAWTLPGVDDLDADAATASSPANDYTKALRSDHVPLLDHCYS
jgi:hypothetical protein